LTKFFQQLCCFLENTIEFSCRSIQNSITKSKFEQQDSFSNAALSGVQWDYYQDTHFLVRHVGATV